MNIKIILKGFIVGIGKIIPGVSGSMLAITLGLYEKILEAITHFFDDAKNHFKLLFNFGIGVFLAIILCSKLILFLLNNYHSEIMYLFLGLILGTLIPFTKELKVNLKNFLIFLISISLTLLLLNIDCHTQFIYTGSLGNYIYISLLGGIDALSSIVPGISGTAIFMMLGSYEFILKILGNPFCKEFIIYGIGAFFGIIIVCYMMNYLLKNKKEETYSVIFAFMIASILILFLNLIDSMNLFLILILIVGILFGYAFDK